MTDVQLDRAEVQRAADWVGAAAATVATVATDQRSAQRLSHLTSRLGPVPQ